MRRVAVLSWVVLLSVQADGGETWVQSPVNQHWYARTSFAFSWDNAEKYANAYGGHLATIRSAAENSWLVSAFGGGVWIGLNDAAVEGTWAWASGEAVPYTSWAPGEPNDYASNEDHATLYTNGEWNDDTGTKFYPAILEVPTGPPGDVDPGELVGDWRISPHSGLWYAVTLVGMDQPTGASIAKTFGGHLGTVHTPSENTWLKNTFGGGGELWLGFSDDAVEGQWEWANGEPAAYYTNWGSGEPNNAGGENHCMMRADGMWNDIAYNSTRPALLMTTYPPGVTQSGDGCPGTGGVVPSLGVSATVMQSGAPLALVVTGGVGAGQALVFFSGSTGETPLGYGCVWNLGPALPFVVGPLTLGGQANGAGLGSLTLYAQLPVVASEVTVATQVFVLDKNVLWGYSNTNAVKMTFGP